MEEDTKIAAMVITAVVALLSAMFFIGWETEGMKHAERMELLRQNPTCVIFK